MKLVKTCENCGFMMSISTWGTLYFWIYLLNHKSICREIRPTNNRYCHGQYTFTKYFGWFKILCTESRLSLIYQPSAINQKPVMVSVWFFTLRENKKHRKVNRSHYIAISLKS